MVPRMAGRIGAEIVHGMPPLWHALAEAEVLGRLDVDGEGLATGDAQQRLERFGPNRLPEASGPSPLVLLLRQLSSPLMWALLLSAAVAILARPARGRARRAGGRRAQRADRVRPGAARGPRHRRAGRRWWPSPRACAATGGGRGRGRGSRARRPGRGGAGRPCRRRTCACCAPRRCAHRRRRSPASRRRWTSSRARSPPSAPLAERHSVLYAGTVVAAGSGEGVAVATGADTELGRISAMLEQADELTTPLTRELDRVGRTITVAIVVAAARARRGGRTARVPGRRRRPGGHQPGGRRGARGAARGGHDRAGHRRPADGPPPGDHPPPARGRDARRHHRGRLGQDRAR